MPVKYRVRAQVVDITIDKPQKNDSFLVDTNVWYWLTYTKASFSANPPKPYQVTAYSGYISNVIANGSMIYRIGASLPELAHSIEATEYEIYSRLCGISPPPQKKEFRHNNAGDRQVVISEIKAAWSQIRKIAPLIDMNVNEIGIDSAIKLIENYPIDGYDSFFADTIIKFKKFLITDDADFITIPNIYVFTANPLAIRLAKDSHNLITR